MVILGDVLKGNNASLLHPYDILYSCIHKEHQLDDDSEFIAAMAAVILSSRFRGHFLV
jgi:predicted regulator of Ras-like GTPase activity (Roadblock/LC7/MglB family)